MRFPKGDEYQQAILRPDLVFQDPELRVCKPETDGWDMPWPRSGGFTITFHLYSSRVKHWAARCFHRPVRDLQQRYAAISRFLNRNLRPIFTPVEYLPNGILVNGQRYPITKMLWLPGETLGLFIERNITNAQIINSLPIQFHKLVVTLEGMGIAHGDLQHGNIMVSNGKLMLIDYDGMYVPELAGLGSNERGHVNYQHPARAEKDFDPHLDRFSSIVIYIALQALTLAPNPSNLWHRYSTGENLLFKQQDFRSPDTSMLLAELEAIPALWPLVKRFRVSCKSDLAQVPRLADFLGGRMLTVAPERWIPAPQRSQYPVIRADQRGRLLESVGQRVTVIGRIVDHTKRVTTHGKPYVFLSFGDWRQGCFRLVVWSEGLQLFEAQKKNPSDYEGKWVSVTGLLTKYSSEQWPERPQIVVEMPSEIEVLAGSEQETRERLSTWSSSQPQAAKLPPSPQPASLVLRRMRSRSPAIPSVSDLYKDWPVTPTATTAKPRASKPISLSSYPARQRTSTVRTSAQTPRLVVPQPSFNFGEIQAGQSEDQRIAISNLGTGSLQVTITKVAPWLSVSPIQFTCAPGTTQWVTVSVKSSLVPGEFFNFNALTIQSNGGSSSISVRAKVVKPILQVDARRIHIFLDRKGRGKGTVKVTNSGSGLLEVRADRPIGFQKDQLEISPSRVSCTAGRSKSFSVSLHMPDLRPDVTLPQGKLVLRSNGGDEEVAITTEVTEPWLLVTPTVIDFGRYEKGPAPVERLHVENVGGGVLQGRIEISSRKEWFMIGETKFRLLAGESRDLILRVISEAVKLRHPAVIRRPLSATIQVISNGGETTLPVELVSVYRGLKKRSE